MIKMTPLFLIEILGGVFERKVSKAQKAWLKPLKKYYNIAVYCQY